jgi:Family of unknown function (DUF5670)
MQAFNFRIHKLYCRPTDFKIQHHVQKFDVVDNLLYFISGIFVLVWAIGFFIMNSNGGIHVFLIIAANLIMLGIIQRQKIKKTN